jgi:uncharacterized protein YjbI with pentapeptide repeats
LNLSRADLSRADLSRADLSRADLSRADLSRADLRAAKLDEANLRAAKLDEANLSEANLSEAIFIGAYLKGAILSGTNLRESVIISPVYSVTHTRIDSNTSFDGAIIDDPAFIHYIRQYTNKVPEKIANIEELKMKLEGMPFITNIKTDLQENLVRRSKLPFFQLRNGNL